MKIKTIDDAKKSLSEYRKHLHWLGEALIVKEYNVALGKFSKGFYRYWEFIVPGQVRTLFLLENQKIVEKWEIAGYLSGMGSTR